jgi:hypothetical protein
MKLPLNCTYAVAPQQSAGDAKSVVACCRPVGWGSPIFSEEQSEELLREILNTMGFDNEKVEAAVRSDAFQRAQQVWAKEPLCRSMAAEREVYRFTWRSSFDGSAVVRVGRQDDEVALRWIHRWFRTPSPDEAPPAVSLTLADWARLQQALFDASFWVFGANEGPLMRGLDGAFWTIEGRREDIYRAASRWSPGGALNSLGRLFFELAGSPLAKVRIY